MVTAREKVYDCCIIIDELKLQPHTYATILTDEECYNATMQFILRRKLNKLCKEGKIYKTLIPGTRGQVILYIEPRNYKIIVVNNRIGVNVYYFFKYEQISKLYIKVDKYWLLNNTRWDECNEEKTFFEGSILKMI